MSEETTIKEPWSQSTFCFAAAQVTMDSAFNHELRWASSMQRNHKLHPTAAKMLEAYEPKDVLALVLAWPYVSEKDPMRLAYTPSQAYGVADRQVITSIGKFIGMHWPHVPDHKRRDAQLLYTPDEIRFVHTTPEMIWAIENGPSSCMKGSNGSIPFDSDERANHQAWLEDKAKPEPDWTLHPYWCYAPEFGWHMAVRTKAGRVDGRAVCLTYKGDKKCFVRTYARSEQDGGYSHADHTLESHLDELGYTKLSSWPQGQKLRTITRYCRYLAPYIDSCCDDGRRVDIGIDDTLIMAEDGPFQCDNTNGTLCEVEAEVEDDTTQCDCCESRIDVDDAYTVGRDEYDHVCEYCRSENYTLVVRRHRPISGPYRPHEYYIPNDEAAEVRGQGYCIDTSEVPENVVQLGDGTGAWAELDDVVMINDCYYMTDDRVVRLKEEHPTTGDCYGLKEDSYKDKDGDWWASEEHYLTVNPPDEEEKEDVQDDNAIDMFARTPIAELCLQI